MIEGVVELLPLFSTFPFYEIRKPAGSYPGLGNRESSFGYGSFCERFAMKKNRKENERFFLIIFIYESWFLQ